MTELQRAPRPPAWSLAALLRVKAADVKKLEAGRQARSAVDEPGSNNPLDYADPERQTGPQFAMDWGGWVLLATLAGLVIAGIVGPLLER